jgi:hypothetical protein
MLCLGLGLSLPILCKRSPCILVKRDCLTAGRVAVIVHGVHRFASKHPPSTVIRRTPRRSLETTSPGRSAVRRSSAHRRSSTRRDHAGGSAERYHRLVGSSWANRSQNEGHLVIEGQTLGGFYELKLDGDRRLRRTRSISRMLEGQVAALAQKLLAFAHWLDHARVVYAAPRALLGGCGVEDMPRRAAVSRHPRCSDAPSVLRPEHLCSAFGTGLGANQSVVHDRVTCIPFSRVYAGPHRWLIDAA